MIYHSNFFPTGDNAPVLSAKSERSKSAKKDRDVLRLSQYTKHFVCLTLYSASVLHQ